MLATKITDHVQAALNRLLQQYRGRPRYEGLITALVQQVQDWENGFYPVDSGRQLWNGSGHPALGAQLDGLGEIVGASRNGLDDATYLVIILGTIAENNSETTYAELRNIVQTVFQASQVFVKTPNSWPPLAVDSPAWIAFGVGDPLTDPTLYLLCELIIKNSIGAGINLNYLSVFNNDNAFAFDGPQSGLGGFGDALDDSVGGEFAEVVFSNPST